MRWSATNLLIIHSSGLMNTMTILFHFSGPMQSSIQLHLLLNFLPVCTDTTKQSESIRIACTILETPLDTYCRNVGTSLESSKGWKDCQLSHLRRHYNRFSIGKTSNISLGLQIYPSGFRNDIGYPHRTIFILPPSTHPSVHSLIHQCIYQKYTASTLMLIVEWLPLS